MKRLNVVDELDESESFECPEFEDFRRAVQKPSKIEQWTALMPFSGIIASALTPMIARKAGEEKHAYLRRFANSGRGKSENENSWRDPLRAVRHVDDEELVLVCEGIKEACLKILKEKVQELNTAYNALDNARDSSALDQAAHGVSDQHSKFAVPEMNCGNIEKFFEGLSGQVGL